MRWKSEWDQVMLDRYAECSNASLAAEFGCREKVVLYHAKRLGLRKSKEYCHKLYSGIAVRCNNEARLNSEKAKMKRVASLEKVVASERARLKWGLEQRTKRHFRLEPRAKLLQRNRLQRLGYIVDEERLVAYWTEGTKRARRLERLKRGEKKGSLISYYDFAPLDTGGVAKSEENE